MIDALEQIARRFADHAPAVDYWSLRLTDEQRQSLRLRQGVLQPLHTQQERGALISVCDGGGIAYAATSDLSPTGLREAARRAQTWAQDSAQQALITSDQFPQAQGRHVYQTPVKQAWDSISLNDKIDLLQSAAQALKIDARIVDWVARLGAHTQNTLLCSSRGAHIAQCFHFISPGLMAVANTGARTQVRTGGGWQEARQGGLEQLAPLGFPTEAPTLAEEAIALLHAPDCPAGVMDLVLAPNQMVLQIHESIGHPLELDRILGDERNYAGTSFVTPNMFGEYRYGSELLNVTFDPTHAEQLASYAYDDEGSTARREYIIRQGILERPLGGACSQARSAMAGVANARQADWYRPPIDRMANLNVEPGTSTFAELISGVERGVYMQTNRSWSIDDSRNKFQFGCEWARLIENGELKGLVRNPNYRGISATFWRNLSGVGDADSFQISGVTNCGKGEPNQAIYVGHATPACRFNQIDVFAGAR